ncbi:hypothetical protein AA11825_2718 [Acetobacter pomorum DSM 11825]|nr:hypothetical protein AA11825_2718 [Acetobacter pomorum DSM 11825]
MEIGDDTFAMDFIVMSRSGIGINHAVPEGIVKQNRYLPSRGGDCLGFPDPR